MKSFLVFPQPYLHSERLHAMWLVCNCASVQSLVNSATVSSKGNIFVWRELACTCNHSKNFSVWILLHVSFRLLSWHYNFSLRCVVNFRNFVPQILFCTASPSYFRRAQQIRTLFPKDFSWIFHVLFEGGEIEFSSLRNEVFTFCAVLFCNRRNVSKI